MLIILIKWLVITIFWEWPLACPGLLCLNLKLSVGPYAIPQCICHNLSWKAQLTQPDTHIEARLRNQQGSVTLPRTRSSHRQFAPSCSLPPDAFVWSAVYHYTSTSVFSFLSSIVCSFSHTNTHTHEHGRNTMFPTGRIYSYVLQLQIQGCHQKPNKIHQ